MQKREGRRRRERITQLSRNLGAHLAAGSRWLGAQAVAAAAALASGDGAVEAAGTLERSGGSAASQHQQLLLFPPLWVWGGPGALSNQ